MRTGILHVEVRLRQNTSFVRADDIRDEVRRCIPQKFQYLSVGDYVPALEDLECNDAVESIKIDGYSGPDEGKPCFTASEIALDIQVYRLHHVDDGTSSTTLAGDSENDRDVDSVLQRFQVVMLPAADLDGLWESLVYPDNMHTDLLRLATRMLRMTQSYNINRNLTNWNGLFLLHGPPGSGKTTLCRGLAQKMRIRLGQVFTQGKLIEIHTEAIFSKYFGESGQILRKVFNKIEYLADSDEDTLLCIMVDEVETMVAHRENSLDGGEVCDAMRVTNGVLTALDRLRHRPNVMVLCTSNLIDAIDSAFLDRADMVQLVPNPGPDAVYSILQSSLNELIKQGVLKPKSVLTVESPLPAPDETDLSSSSLVEKDDGSFVIANPTLFPSILILKLKAVQGSLALRLWQLSERCLGMSGRRLRRLPSKAVGLYAYSDRPSVEEALDALQATLDKEKWTKDG